MNTQHESAQHECTASGQTINTQHECVAREQVLNTEHECTTFAPIPLAPGPLPFDSYHNLAGLIYILVWVLARMWTCQ